MSASVLGNWEARSPVPVARSGATAVTIEDTIYVIGGRNNQNGVLSRVDVYYPLTDTWDELKVPPLNSARSNAAAIVYNNHIYVLGGRDDDNVLNSAEVYNPSENEWEYVQNLRNAREGAFVLNYKNRLHVFGGATESGNLVDDVEWYEPGEDEWYDADFEFDPPRVSAFSFVNADTVFIFGGFYFSPLKSSLKLSPDTLWYEGPSMNEAKGAGSTAVVGENVYFIGGESNQSVTSQVERYNFITKNIVFDLNLTTARAGHACTVHNGTIYVFGGYGENPANILSSVEAYNPTISSIMHNKINQEPTHIELFPNFPNPFNGSTQIRFALRYSEFVNLSVFDVSGRQVAEILNKKLAAGYYNITWHGDSRFRNTSASNIYFVVLRTLNSLLAQKVIYLK